MPRTGTPRSKTRRSTRGAPFSYTLSGPPESTIPRGERARRAARVVLGGTISEYTCSSRRRRAMSCVYCDPKSRMTMASRSMGRGALEGGDYTPRPGAIWTECHVRRKGLGAIVSRFRMRAIPGSFLSVALAVTLAGCHHGPPVTPRPLFPMAPAWTRPVPATVEGPLAADSINVYVATRDGAVRA